MCPLRVETLRSAGEIRQCAPAWDRLWERSEVTLPTVRAELVAQWIEHFAPQCPVYAVVVWRGDTLVAALPLVQRRIAGVVRAGDLTSNFWAPNGELLVAPDDFAPEVMTALAARLTRLPWPWLWLDLVPAASSAWPALTSAFASAGMPFVAVQRYEIGQVDIRDQFEPYLNSRSKNLRRSLHRDLKRLEQAGPLAMRWQTAFAPHEVEAALHAALRIEQRSWKATRGQPVLDQPGLFDFYLRQCRQLAAWGCLRIATLLHAGQPIAFELGWVAKGTYHSFKVGFDEQYRRAAPGQVLRWKLIEQCFRQRDVKCVDFMGPLTQALAAWSTRTYPVCRLVVSTGGLGGRVLVAAYRAARSMRTRWRDRKLAAQTAAGPHGSKQSGKIPCRVTSPEGCSALPLPVGPEP